MCARKRYRRAAFFTLFFLLCAPVVQARNYRQIFGREYASAERTLRTLQPALEKYGRNSPVDAQMIEAVVFPEVMRYNAFFDVLETGSLYALYTRFGENYSNFSIGRFQMKPSFAVSIEQLITQEAFRPMMREMGFTDGMSGDTFESRKARVSRLEDTEWQLRYFRVFAAAMERRVPKWEKLGRKERVQWLAAAYNGGWTRSVAEIRRGMIRKQFHMSVWGKAPLYSYADVALYRYKELTGRSPA
ncbi:MAG: hypothetical protein INR69_11140 [Mucilaginibacter polytrichastri]|nr:hypothetical protein [Mucilaginibacter polytrichastri]